MKKVVLIVLALATILFLGLEISHADTYTDNFNSDSGPQLPWQNQVGGWYTSGGVYNAEYPGNGEGGTSMTYTSLPYDFRDFYITVDMNQASDGGIWLRSSYSETTGLNGVLLVVGGSSTNGTGMYFQTFTNGAISGPFEVHSNVFSPGDTITVKVVVSGDTYTAYISNAGGWDQVSQFTNTDFSSGQVGLYDFSPGAQVPGYNLTFDNVYISGSPVPLPGAVWLLGSGLLGLAGWRRFRKS